MYTVAVSPDGQSLAAGGEHGTLVIFDVKTGKLLQRLKDHATEGTEFNVVRSLAFTPNGEQLISAGDDKKILVWQRCLDNQFSLKTSWLAVDKVKA
ncbi:WD40 repeat domain-containing protein, partial [Methyloglobulus sp.]|uniref:WD40 repeat domain-containing protein n=1 Tax=Methyloglobulus sp. TaxID=2518622 RepID=UPI003989F7EC